MLYGIKYGWKHNGEVEDWRWLRLSNGEVFWTEHEGVALAQLESCIDAKVSSETRRYDARIEHLPGQRPSPAITVFEGEPI